MLSLSVCRDLAATFAEHDYVVDAVIALIGEQAHRALGRNSTVPAVRAIAGHDGPLATLTRLWLLQQPTPRDALDRALPGLVPHLVAGGIVAASVRSVRALIDLRPYASDDGAGGWIASDLSPNLDTKVAPMRADFVLGVSSASSTLAQLTCRRTVGRALDLGTGCGVQSLHLARHSGDVVATDLNPRAVSLAALTFALNGVAVDVREGSLFAPVATERFDLITSNPPYVMAPPTTDERRLAYREGAEPGDGLVRRVVCEGAERLTEGGLLQVLANWAHVRAPGAAAAEWAERLAGWIAPTGCDAHVIQREVLDVPEYVELWLADAGLAGSASYRQRYEEWLDYFARLGIEAVGMGWLTLRRTGSDRPSVTIEDWPYAVEQPVGAALAARLDALARLRDLDDAALLTTHPRLAADVVEETQGVPGLADPHQLVLRQQRGLRRAIRLDTATAAVLGACDGELSLGTIIRSVSGLLGLDPSELAATTVVQIRELVVDGLLAL